ncbi:GNAT family N-acetyltransferase [Fibrella sp. HMF5036]|uniref:GNAT family N-acetyltransferase n=2 Tax=Fibrella aquatilis TaxID=2817059 RepID=A0A939G307_9BACT|nr:GNAT family N-acetyltransferase [Fibrella aquatilis]
MENVEISTDKARLDVAMVHRFLSKEAYWSKNIPLDTVQRSIEGSLCFGIYLDNQQVGFARVITDYATFAYLADVFVLPEHRGKGLSKQLIAYIMAYPSLQGLRRWMLITYDAHGLYEQFGFKPTTENPQNTMFIKPFEAY